MRYKIVQTYRTLEEDELNELAEQGWRLEHVIRAALTVGSERSIFEYIFAMDSDR